MIIDFTFLDIFVEPIFDNITLVFTGLSSYISQSNQTFEGISMHGTPTRTYGTPPPHRNKTPSRTHFYMNFFQLSLAGGRLFDLAFRCGRINAQTYKPFRKLSHMHQRRFHICLQYANTGYISYTVSFYQILPIPDKFRSKHCIVQFKMANAKRLSATRQLSVSGLHVLCTLFIVFWSSPFFQTNSALFNATLLRLLIRAAFVYYT